MSLAVLSFCAASIYTFFLLWGLLQERLSTHLYPVSQTPATSLQSLFSALFFGHNGKGSSIRGVGGDKFSSPLFLNATQSLFCALIAAAYLLLFKASAHVHTPGSKAEKPKTTTPLQRLGLHALTKSGAQQVRKPPKQTKASPTNGHATKLEGKNGHVAAGADGEKTLVSPLLSKYVLISFFQSTASQLGFLALSQGLSYPTLTLAKSCKLVPVLIMNVLLYQRKFALYKYAVVALVTVGISLFMLYGEKKAKKPSKAKAGGAGGNTLLGLAFLTLNLVLDGATNSTQDEVFGQYAISGPQMMLVMNAFSFLLMLSALVVPFQQLFAGLLPPALGAHLGLHELKASTEGSELTRTIAFISTHPSVLRDVVAYGAAGALGQIAIFETLERFGSLTLVSITVTRKLFTMLLSVFIYNHRLTTIQWLGVAIVFAGIGIEAREKRREGLAKKVLHDEKKALSKDA